MFPLQASVALSPGSDVPSQFKVEFHTQVADDMVGACLIICLTQGDSEAKFLVPAPVRFCQEHTSQLSPNGCHHPERSQAQCTPTAGRSQALQGVCVEMVNLRKNDSNSVT